MNKLNLQIRKTILEHLIKEEEIAAITNRKRVYGALVAFIEGKAKVTGVEENEEETFSNAIDKNDFHPNGYSYMEESPMISFTFNHVDYMITATLEKQYYYKYEPEGTYSPSVEDIQLQEVDIKSPNILIYEEGDEYSFRISEIGGQNIKRLEKIIKSYIK
jgi:hypothetical protein